MGIITDCITAYGLSKVRPKAVQNNTESIFTSIDIRYNFIMFGGSSGSVNEYKALSALETKIAMCHNMNYPAVILTSNIEWARRISGVYPDITAFGFNAGYVPFSNIQSRMEAEYVMSGIVDSYRNIDSRHNYGIKDFCITLINILEQSYGLRYVTYDNLCSLAHAVFISDGINGFVSWVRSNGGTVSRNNLYALNRIWDNHLPQIRVFWTEMQRQFSRYNPQHFHNRSSSIFNILQTGSPISLFYVDSVDNNILRSAIYSDISLAGRIPFPYCFINYNVPLINQRNIEIFAPYNENSVDFGMYFTTLNQFGRDTEISSVSATIDNILCLGAKSINDAQVLASQVSGTAYRWLPSVHRGNIGMTMTPVQNIEPYKLLTGRKGVPDGSMYVFNGNGIKFFHSWGIRGR